MCCALGALDQGVDHEGRFTKIDRDGHHGHYDGAGRGLGIGPNLWPIELESQPTSGGLLA
jgi:hypothetical protein